MRGLDFGDNAVQRYVTDDNGVAVAKTKVKQEESGIDVDQGEFFTDRHAVDDLCLDLPKVESLA